MAASRQYRLRVGEVVLGLDCPDADYADSLAEYFAQASDPAEPTVRLELEPVSGGARPAIPNSLILAKTLRPDGFDIADGLISGRYDAGAGAGELRVDRVLTGGLLTRVFEQILYQAWHSGRARLGYDACLVHSAGVVRDGRGFLFVGPSEAGKSTVADLSGADTVLNDEMNIVEFRPEGPWLVGTPFNGHYRAKRAGAAPLAAILLLAHGPRHELQPVGAGAAAATVAGQVTPPVGLDEAAAPATSLAMLDLATRLVQSAPVRRLVFLPDGGFWPLLDRAFTQDSRGR
jgi:hypothetical protein